MISVEDFLYSYCIRDILAKPFSSDNTIREIVNSIRFYLRLLRNRKRPSFAVEERQAVHHRIFALIVYIITTRCMTNEKLVARAR